MRWWRRVRAEPAPVEKWTTRELARSDEALRAAQRDVIVPLKRIREQNNVTALVRLLLQKDQGDAKG